MSKISADNISNKLDTKEVPTETVIAGSAKAWVNFNGTGTVAIRDSFNVSSITDNGVGDYTVNFTAALNNANYVVLGTVSDTSTFRRLININDATAPSTAAVRMQAYDSAGVLDNIIVCVVVHANN